MPKEIPLDQIGNFVEGQVERLLRKTVLQTDSLLKQASPVDTGRFRASWQVGQLGNSSTPKPPGKYPQAPPLTAYNYTPGKEKLGNYYSVHNNVPYADKLADAPLGQGSSLQTNGPGWVDLIAKDMQDYVKAEYERIKRQS